MTRRRTNAKGKGSSSKTKLEWAIGLRDWRALAENEGKCIARPIRRHYASARVSKQDDMNQLFDFESGAKFARYALLLGYRLRGRPRSQRGMRVIFSASTTETRTDRLPMEPLFRDHSPPWILCMYAPFPEAAIEWVLLRGGKQIISFEVNETALKEESLREPTI